MDRCLRKNPHFSDQGDMKIGKQDTHSPLLMFRINKGLCYRQLFLQIHALTAAIFSFWYKECLLLAEIADSKRLCEVLSVFEIFEEIPWSVNCGSIGVGGLRGGRRFLLEIYFFLLDGVLFVLFYLGIFIWYFFGWCGCTSRWEILDFVQIVLIVQPLPAYSANEYFGEHWLVILLQLDVVQYAIYRDLQCEL